MAQVTVTIDGKAFRMACEDGQEGHLEGLASHLDARIKTMRQSFGEIGDLRLTVMAALMICDELHEARENVRTAETAMQAREAAVQGAGVELSGRDREIAGVIEALAGRVERIAGMLGGTSGKDNPA